MPRSSNGSGVRGQGHRFGRSDERRRAGRQQADTVPNPVVESVYDDEACRLTFMRHQAATDHSGSRHITKRPDSDREVLSGLACADPGCNMSWVVPMPS